MSALPQEDFKVGRAITAEEWKALREESLYGLPEALRELPRSEILLGYQKRSIRARLSHEVTFIEKSRRTGLTWAFASDAVLVSAADHSAGGMDTFYIGYNLEMAREFIDVCAMWAKLFAKAAVESGEYLFEDLDPATGETRQVKAFRIRFSSGFEIVALPSRPRSLRGKQGYVIIDEAAFHDDLAELLKAAMALLIWGGMVVVISTHDGEANTFNQYVKDIRAGVFDYGIVRIDFDEALREGLYQRICQRKGEDWTAEGEAEWRSKIIAHYGQGADEELFCIPSEGSGVWLLPAVIEANMKAETKVLRWEMPSAFAAWPARLRREAAQAWLDQHVVPQLHRILPDKPSFLGEDFGRISDLSVIWPVQLAQGMHRHTPFVIELRNIPFDEQEFILWWVIDHLPRFGAGALDAGGNGAALAERTAQRYGMERIAQIKFTVDWYRANMPLLKQTLEALGMDVPKDVDVGNDLRIVRMIDGIARLPRVRNAEKGEGAADGKKKTRHGDAAIAAVLAHFASLMPVVSFAYQAVTGGAPGLGVTGAGGSPFADHSIGSMTPSLRGRL
ncbi:terminase large subunit domain-containing protein [Bosea sp. 685]|uniref:terminase large subunit domain-containing protein n=1 Tax=Bosea sp. 685 TaxID=3080057 RepID=UPI0028934EC1|nr:terminase family protein [Bosea sp. 685]WNJ89158.1 hypothetical protein RMR04_22470 [Bosea sp. 685]